MPRPNDKVNRGGVVLTQRVWDLIADVEKATGQDLVVVQGGFQASTGDGAGADASAGTHDVGDVFDVSRRDATGRAYTDSQLTAIAVEFRRRNVLFWWRMVRYGWTKTGEHGHGVVRDSFYGLSAGAKDQVSQYDRGLDGLSQRTASLRPYKGKDYHPRPTQRRWPWSTPKPVVTWDGVKNDNRGMNTLVQQELNALTGDRFSAPVTGRFADTRGPLFRLQVAWLQPTKTATLRRLGNRRGKFIVP